MEIVLAETAGFCFGVNRAVNMVYDLIDRGEKVCTLGPIIHNPQIVEELARKGVRTVNDPKEALPGEVQVTVTNGKKWSFAKTPTIKYVKNGAGEYVLSGLDDELKTNVSALKLSYTAGSGLFRGNLKVYSTNADAVAKGKAPKIKKHNVTVTGMMVNGAGEGLATCKNPKTESWKVTVK